MPINMRIIIHQDVSQRYPDYRMGVMEIKITRYDIDALQKILASNVTINNVPRENEKAELKWMQVFNEMKASSKRLPSIVSLRNLYERFGELRGINYFVDAYNHISMKHGIPMGGYDIDNLPADDITLRYAKKGDKFHPLGLDQIEKIKDESEIVYYSGNDVITRYWNNKDSESTKITDKTKRLVIIFDYFGESEFLKAAMDDLEALFRSTGNVEYLRKSVLSSQNSIYESELYGGGHDE